MTTADDVHARTVLNEDGYTFVEGESILAEVDDKPGGMARLSRALADAGVIQRLLDQGVEATPGSPAAFRQLIVAETERWRKVIKSAGITAEAAQ